MTDLIEVRSTNLSGEALGWAVAKVEGHTVELVGPHYGNGWRVFRVKAPGITQRFNPWEDWALGGLLIDKHHGTTQHIPDLPVDIRCAGGPAYAGWCYGPTALVAFCRGLVHYKLGEFVWVPKELCP